MYLPGFAEWLQRPVRTPTSLSFSKGDSTNFSTRQHSNSVSDTGTLTGTGYERMIAALGEPFCGTCDGQLNAAGRRNSRHQKSAETGCRLRRSG